MENDSVKSKIWTTNKIKIYFEKSLYFFIA
jgi:hypothetical protein